MCRVMIEIIMNRKLLLWLLTVGLAGLTSDPACGDEDAGVLSGATMIPELSDDFEDPRWAFDPVAGESSNGLWQTGMRGAPETCERVTPAGGGLSDQTGALLLRSVDQDDDGWPQQEDLVTRKYDEVLEENLKRALMPVLTARVYVPPIPEQGPAWSVLGLRVEARSTNQQLEIPRYYPSLWIVQYNIPEKNKVGNHLRVRLGDGSAPDQWIGEFGDPRLEFGDAPFEVVAYRRRRARGRVHHDRYKVIGSTIRIPVSRRSRSFASWVAPSTLASVE